MSDPHSLGAVPTRGNAMHETEWRAGLVRPGNRLLEPMTAQSAWFQILRVDARTFALLEPFHFQEVISYLILGSREALLLDTGMGFADIRAEVMALTYLPVTVVNSHSHFDHVAGDHLFECVWAYDTDEGVASIERGLSAAESRFIVAEGEYIRPPAGFDPATYQVRPAHVSRRLRGGDRIDLGGRLLEVFHTPGHSPDSLCLLDESHRLLFTGDTFYPGALYAHFHGSNPEDYVASLDELAALSAKVEWVCPSHNEARISPAMLPRAAEALRRVRSGQAVPERVEDGLATYRFDGFGVIAPLA